MPRLSAKDIGAVVFALLASASMWFYVDRVLIPYEVRDAAEHQRPRGNLSDLYPRWLGSHELLLHGRDPYSPEVTRQIQAGYYGRALDPSHPNDPRDQQGFAYPVYVVFLLAPTLNLPFPIVQKGFGLFLWVLTAGSVLLWLWALRWRPSIPAVLVWLLLTLGSFPAVQGIKLQQLSLLVAGMLAGSIALLVEGWLVPAGILLAFCTIKPQLAWLPASWVLLWCAYDWRRRQRLAWSFGVTMLLLLGGSELLLRGWIGRFWTAVQQYQQYTHNASVLGSLLSPALGNVVALILLVAAAILCWPALSKPANSGSFRAALSLMLSLTVLVVPMFAPYNQVFLLPALMVLVRELPGLWPLGPARRFLCGVTAVALIWPWAVTVALMVWSGLLPAARVQSAWWLPFVPTFALPLLVFALLALHAKNLIGQASAVSGSA